MKDLIKKTFLLGVGTASLTKKKAEKVVNRLVKKDLLKKKDGVALVKNMIAEANKERKRIQKFIETEAKREIKRIKPHLAKASKKATKEGEKVLASSKKKAGHMVKKGKARARKTLRKVASKIR